MNRVMCPFPDTHNTGCICKQVLNVSSIWDHCRSCHSSETHLLEAKPNETEDIDVNAFSACLSLPLTLTSRHNIFFSVTAEDVTLNFCLHMYMVNDDDGRKSLCIALRRFFSDQTAVMKRMMMSIEIENCYGLIFPLSGTLSSHDVVQEMDFDQLDSIVRIPITLLRHMQNQGFDFKMLKLIYTLQTDFVVVNSEF